MLRSRDIENARARPVQLTRTPQASAPPTSRPDMGKPPPNIKAFPLAAGGWVGRGDPARKEALCEPLSGCQKLPSLLASRCLIRKRCAGGTLRVRGKGGDGRAWRAIDTTIMTTIVMSPHPLGHAGRHEARHRCRGVGRGRRSIGRRPPSRPHAVAAVRLDSAVPQRGHGPDLAGRAADVRACCRELPSRSASAPPACAFAVPSTAELWQPS